MLCHTNMKHQIYVCVYEFRNCRVRQTGGCEQCTDSDGVSVWSQRKQLYRASDDGTVCARQRLWSSLESEASNWNDSTQSYSCGDQLSVTSLPHIVQSCKNSWREQKHFRQRKGPLWMLMGEWNWYSDCTAVLAHGINSCG